MPTGARATVPFVVVAGEAVADELLEVEVLPAPLLLLAHPPSNTRTDAMITAVRPYPAARDRRSPEHGLAPAQVMA